MRILTEYLSAKIKQSIIKVTNDNVKDVVREEVRRLGMEADLNHIDVSKCTQLDEVFHTFFIGDESFKGDVSKWNTENITSLYYTFAYCYNFNCDLSEWDVHNVKGMRNCFYKCQDFEGIGLENWNTESLEDAGSLFAGCSKFNCDVSSWNTENLNKATYMFAYCHNFDKNLSNWDVYNVSAMSFMFYECKKIKFDVSKWDMSHCETCASMFADTDYYRNLSKWDLRENLNVENMFSNCPKMYNNKKYWPQRIKDAISKQHIPSYKIFGY